MDRRRLEMRTQNGTLQRIFAAAGLALALAACGEPATPEAPSGAPPADGGAPAPAPAEVTPERVTESYDRGLDYLHSQQEDGVWKVQEYADHGISALCVTAMIERPGGVRPKDRPVIEKALDFLAGSLAEDGGVDSPQYRNYSTSVVVMALVAGKRPQDRAKVDAAVRFVRSLQFAEEGDPSFGGIGYGSDRTRSDLSNTQYALASLRAAGVPETDPVFQRALVFLNRTQNRKENETAGEPTEWRDGEKRVVRSNDGGANYRPGDSKAGTEARPDGTQELRSYGSMTYALLRCYHLAGVGLDDGRMQDAVEWIAANWELDRNPGMPEDMALDGLYYYYATIGKTLPALGIDALDTPSGKVDWRSELASELIGRQREDGSWASSDPRWYENLPVLATSYALTALRACVE